MKNTIGDVITWIFIHSMVTVPIATVVAIAFGAIWDVPPAAALIATLPITYLGVRDYLQ